MKFIYSFFLLFILLQSCVENFAVNEKISKQIFIKNDTLIEVEIDEDSVYIGDYKMYVGNKKTLIKHFTYKNGILNGPFVYFHSNGKPQVTSNYLNGEINGFVEIYDSLGNLNEKYYSHLGLEFGDKIIFQDSVPVFYGFYDPFSKYLFEWDYEKEDLYDKIDEKRFFFFTKGMSHDSLNRVYTVFLIRPPKCRFEYSYYAIDFYSNDTIFSRPLVSELPFINFEIPVSNNIYKLKVEIYNEANELAAIIHKVLE